MIQTVGHSSRTLGAPFVAPLVQAFDPSSPAVAAWEERSGKRIDDLPGEERLEAMQEIKAESS